MIRGKASLWAIVFMAVVVWGTRAQAIEAPVYEELVRYYEYDANMPLDAESQVVREKDTHTVERVVFSSTNGERVTSLLEMPKGDGVFPALVLLHGYTGRKEDWDEPGVLDAFGLQGVAAIAIDAEFHGERKEAGADVYDTSNWQRSRDAMIQTIVDCRRAVDVLLSRPQVDPERIGFIGGSMGAILGAVFCAVEPRIACAVLVVGGADWGLMLEKSEISVAKRARDAGPVEYDEVRKWLAPVDPLYFVSHISPRPILFQNGSKDTIVPVEANKLLIETAREPKEVDWYDAGHGLPHGKLAMRVNGWLREKLRFGTAKDAK